jgi:hypothetical protein
MEEDEFNGALKREGYLDAFRGYPLPKGANKEYREGWEQRLKQREQECNELKIPFKP